MTLEYAKVGEADADELGELLARAFAIPAADERAWMHERAGLDALRLVRRGPEIVGGCAVIPMRQYFGGRAIAMGGIAGVGVRTDARRTGVASAMMRGVLHELHEHGTPLSTLYASNAPLYRGVGYETAGARYVLRIPARDAHAAQRSLVARNATEADAEELHALYRRIAVRRNGHLERCRYIWPRLHDVRFGVPAHGLVFRDEHGAVEAYVYWRQKTGNMFYDVEITDAVAATPRGLRTIWTAIGDLRSMAQDVLVPTAPTDPLYLMLPDPRFELRHVHAWMVRLVDVGKALAARGYSESIRARLELRVHDDVIAANDGTFVVDIRGGVAEVERGGSGSIELDVRALATLFSGFADPWTLAATGALRADEGALARLSACFGDGAPWMPEMF
jgi:predicted acetyltransferase